MNILLPTDFSENSRNAAAYALQFFKEVACTFHLLHVLPIAENNSLTEVAAQEKFEELLVWLQTIKQHPQHEFKMDLKSDYFIEAIRKQVLEKNIDLIMMGTKGYSNHKTTLMGKNTSDVMMKVKCPVMAISENALFRKPREILFPTDYNIRYSGKMLEVLHQLLFLSKASVKILELFNSGAEPSEAQLDNRLFLQNSFGQTPTSFQTFYLSKTTNYRNLFSSNRNVDMIVMVAKNLNICQKLLHAPNNDQIPFINRLPLLMLH